MGVNRKKTSRLTSRRHPKTGTRTARACETCRRKKIKCSGGPAPCVGCRALDLDCEIHHRRPSVRDWKSYHNPGEDPGSKSFDTKKNIKSTPFMTNTVGRDGKKGYGKGEIALHVIPPVTSFVDNQLHNCYSQSASRSSGSATDLTQTFSSSQASDITSESTTSDNNCLTPPTSALFSFDPIVDTSMVEDDALTRNTFEGVDFPLFTETTSNVISDEQESSWDSSQWINPMSIYNWPPTINESDLTLPFNLNYFSFSDHPHNGYGSTSGHVGPMSGSFPQNSTQNLSTGQKVSSNISSSPERTSRDSSTSDCSGIKKRNRTVKYQRRRREDSNREEALEKNRVAAAKCRDKKREREEQLQHKSRQYHMNNTKLKLQVTKMKEQVHYMKAFLLAHTCTGHIPHPNVH